MDKAICVLLSLMLLLPGSLIGNEQSIDKSRTLYVGGDGPGNYTKIQEAIDDAMDGDTIFVYNGIYNENLVIDKSLFLIGENRSATIVNGNGIKSIAILDKDGIRVENFTMRNSGGMPLDSGMKLLGKSIIDKCSIAICQIGICINSSSEVNSCLFYGNGIGINVNSKSVISNCHFFHNGIGIEIQSRHNSVSNCSAIANGVAISIDNSDENKINNCSIRDNNDNQGGISLYNSSGNNISKCEIEHNGFGIRLIKSFNNLIYKCDVYRNTHNGIKIDKSNFNSISFCNISSNKRFGIFISDSFANQISYNNIVNSTLQGIYAKFSFVDARKNWWGAPSGPSGRWIGRGDELIWVGGRISYFPWLIHPIDGQRENRECNMLVEKGDAHVPKLDGSKIDDDFDGIPNEWEIKWGYDPFQWDDHYCLDPDGDGLTNMEEWEFSKLGANPHRKDIFLEIDWMSRNGENYKLLNEKDKELLINAFARRNVSLHVDDGSMGGGEPIGYRECLTYPKLHDVYWNYFLHNDPNNPRKGVFHYAVLCHYVFTREMGGFAFVGWDNLDSFVIAVQKYKDRLPEKMAEHAIATGIMHELGHTLGLFVDNFEGIDNRSCYYPWMKGWWKYANYKSCLNYRYAWFILDYSDGSHGKNDFDDWDNLDFDFFKNSSWG